MREQQYTSGNTYVLDQQAIINETYSLLRWAESRSYSTGLFKVKSANEWIEHAKTRPTPKMLFDKFWFEGEVCILFADTNLGKSILAVQIADSISRGKPIPGFKCEADGQIVLYFDFELSDKQFETRYSAEFSNHYSFSDKLLRVEIDQDAEHPTGLDMEEFLVQSLESSISITGAKVLIIDNITYLKNETEKAKDALPLMKYLKMLGRKHELSILALAHTPKRDLSKPVTRNDLQGSKMLMNFCDSSFAIGESHKDKDLRYLKQIKQRNTESIYDSDNVCICSIVKEKNFLQLEFIKTGYEADHLKQYSENDKQKVEQQVIEYYNEGKSFRQIGEELGISHMKAKRLWDKSNSNKV